jgi:hypothetical protein
MSKTNKKKGSKGKTFKGNPCLYVVHVYKRDGVKKTVKQLMKRKARRKNKLIPKEPQ